MNASARTQFRVGRTRGGCFRWSRGLRCAFGCDVGSCVPRRLPGHCLLGRTDFPRRSGTSRLAGKRSTRSRWSSALKGPREGSALTCRTPDQLAGVPAVVESTWLGYALLCGACRVGGRYFLRRRGLTVSRSSSLSGDGGRSSASDGAVFRTSLRRQPESSSRSTRLETRTKESNVCASRWVPCRGP
uniref:Uncharacterized protein n=1 Tax=Cacopsylla melanoneura TaxID=428564 RepID=A0A8D8LZR7_9HEMI